MLPLLLPSLVAELSANYRERSRRSAGADGFMLELSGFVPNQPQTMTTQLWMVGLYGIFPLVCYTVGAILFSRFKLDEAGDHKGRPYVGRFRPEPRAGDGLVPDPR